MRIVFESYFCYWCILFCYCTFLLGGFLDYARNDSSPATAGSYVFVCCVWIARLRLGGPSISPTPHSGRHGGKRACRPERNASGVERVSLFSAATLYIVLGLCLLCMCCTSTVRGSFDYRSGRQGKIRGSFGYAQDDIGVRLRLRGVLRFR